MQKKALFLGGSPGTHEMIGYMKGQGIYTIVTDYIDIEHSRAKRLADEYWMISYVEVDVLEKKCRDDHIGIITAASSPAAVESMIELCRRLNLPCYITEESFYYEKNKAAFKRKCREVGAPVPKDFKLSEELLDEEISQVEFPVVVKPVDKCGGKGVTFCNNKEELVEAYHKVREISDNPEIIVEKKMVGREFAAYYALADGEAAFLCLCSELPANKKCPGPCFVSSTVTKFVDDFVLKVNDKIIEVLKACGFKENVVWVQVRQDDEGEFHILELGYRLGADLIPIEYGYVGELDLAKWAAECALGVKHEKESLPIGLKHQMKSYAYSYMLCCGKSGTIKEIKGVQELRARKVDVILDICEGDELNAFGKEIGCIGFIATSIDELCFMIEYINKNLLILDEKGENMIYLYMSVERFMQEDVH